MLDGTSILWHALTAVFHAAVHIAGHEIFVSLKPERLRSLVRNQHVTGALQKSYLAALMLLEERFDSGDPDRATRSAAKRSFAVLRSHATHVFPTPKEIETFAESDALDPGLAAARVSLLLEGIEDAPPALKTLLDESFADFFTYTFREIGLKRSPAVRAVILDEALREIQASVASSSLEISRLRESLESQIIAADERLETALARFAIALHRGIGGVLTRIDEILASQRQVQEALDGEGPIRGYILISDEDGSPVLWEKTRSTRVTIGRGEGCDVRLTDRLVSSMHARITIDGSFIEVQDLGSENGTTVNGEVVRGKTIRFGDIIGIGRHRIQIHSPDDHDLFRTPSTLPESFPAGDREG